MNNFKLENFRHVHFVGIGGVSMHALALYCKRLQLGVSGSDINKNKYTEICKDNGIRVCFKHKRKNIDGADLIVRSGAISEGNIEIIQARARGIKIIDRAELLAYICKSFKYVIGVAGTHGKTTTSAMIYHVLNMAGLKVSCHIGGDVENARLDPSDEYLVLECCEYNKSFLRFDCDISVLLNIDNDHLDCYGNMYNLRNAFKTFVKRAKTRFVFSNASTACVKSKANRIKPAKVLSGNKFMYNNKKYILDNVYGEHNINNATVAAVVCNSLGVSYTKVYKALKTFNPVGRRCELLGKIKKCDIIADYAHHPSEIQCLYNGLKLKYGKINLVFQPHTYSRTKLLLHEFVKLFSGMDNLTIYKEYSARECKNKGYSAKQLAEYLDNAQYVKSYKMLKSNILSNHLNDENSCICFVGAGDIYEIGLKVIEDLGKT